MIDIHFTTFLWTLASCVATALYWIVYTWAGFSGAIRVLSLGPVAALAVSMVWTVFVAFGIWPGDVGVALLTALMIALEYVPLVVLAMKCLRKTDVLP